VKSKLVINTRIKIKTGTNHQ